MGRPKKLNDPKLTTIYLEKDIIEAIEKLDLNISEYLRDNVNANIKNINLHKELQDLRKKVKELTKERNRLNKHLNKFGENIKEVKEIVWD